jgi:hypothetical protein
VIATGSGVAALEGVANAVNPSAAEPFITSRRLMGFRIVQAPWMPMVAMVRDARRCRAPHHEGLAKPHPEERPLGRVSKPHPEERALARVSKDGDIGFLCQT